MRTAVCRPSRGAGLQSALFSLGDQSRWFPSIQEPQSNYPTSASSHPSLHFLVERNQEKLKLSSQEETETAMASLPNLRVMAGNQREVNEPFTLGTKFRGCR